LDVAIMYVKPYNSAHYPGSLSAMGCGSSANRTWCICTGYSISNHRHI